jgi:pSer/pThr/pTyr-binding forkhead associated (FHA) protein
MNIYRLKGTSGPVINRVFPLGQRLLIGRADDCAVRIDLDGVAGHHAEVRLTDDGGVRLRNLDPARQTLLNGVAVEERALSGGDEIRVGNCRFLLQAPGLKPDRVLTGEAVAVRRRHWPWLLVFALLGAAALAWQRGWLAM